MNTEKNDQVKSKSLLYHIRIYLTNDFQLQYQDLSYYNSFLVII